VQKSTVGGILSIVAGALGLLGGLLCIVIAVFAASIFNGDIIINNGTTSDQQVLTVLAIIYGTLGAVDLILGALGIVGGIFALQRKQWGWALAGAIVSCLTFLPLGIGAVVLVAMGKSEFTQDAPPILSQSPANGPTPAAV